MKYTVTAGEMKQYDANTMEKLGIPGAVLMERAALAAFGEIEKYMENKRVSSKQHSKKRVLILAGMGNNGGDGLALARLLADASYRVEVWCVGNMERASAQWRQQFAILKNYPVETGSKPLREEYNVLIDALFGVGLSGAVTGEAAAAIEQFNELNGYKVALDIPSGIDSDTGRILGSAVKADMTVSFGFHKRGTLLYPGCLYSGEVRNYSIGINERSFFGREPDMFFYDEALEALLPLRDPAGNKGTFGKVLLVAGSPEMAGAAVLAAKAAYRVGAGMVKAISAPENKSVLQGQVPEVLFGTPDAIVESLEWADVIAAGPGLSTGKKAQEILRTLVYDSRLPLVLDADALNLLSEDAGLREELSCQGKEGRELILTPHVGELSRLMSRSAAQLKENLAAAGRELAGKLHGIIAAKDARTYVCREDGAVCLNLSGNSGMATAGSGDVLTGIIAGLLAQHMDAFEAASVGVYLHGRAGDLAAQELGEYGLTAGDIIKKAYLGRLTKGN